MCFLVNVDNLFNHCFNPLKTGTPLLGSLANSEDTDEMLHNAKFHRPNKGLDG